ADSANQKAADSPLIELAQPKADIVMEDGSWLALTARKGLYDKNVQVLQLTGAVNLFHDKGYEFRTESATFDLKAGDAHGVDPVQGQGPFGQLDAQGFVIYNRGERVVFTGKSKLVLQPEALEKR
ncbi:MAG: LPS export ABC transporter periplasmic protein LptC, partial [Alphaproteobacteria bacterium]